MRYFFLFIVAAMLWNCSPRPAPPVEELIGCYAPFGRDYPKLPTHVICLDEDGTFSQRQLDKNGDTVFENTGSWELSLYLDTDTFINFDNFQYMDGHKKGELFQNSGRQFRYNSVGRISVEIRLDWDDNIDMVYFVKLRTQR